MNFKLLKNRDFTLLILGKFVSLLGTYIQDLALALYVLKLTGSSLIFGSVITIALIPRLILSPICGVLADRFDRKKIVVYLDMLSGLIIGILFVISITVGVNLIHIYTSVIALSVISSLFQPAIGAAIPAIVKKEELVDANAFNSAVMTVGGLLSPILAALLYTSFGLSVVLLVNAISFVCSSISEMFIRFPAMEKKNEKFSFGEFKKDFVEGLSFIKQQKQLMRLMYSALIVNIAFNPVFSIGFIVIVKMVIKASDMQLGYMNTILVIGSLIGTLLAGAVSKRLSLIKIFYGVLFICGIVVILMAANTLEAYLDMFNTNLIPYFSFMGLCFIIALTVAIVNIAMMTLMQQLVPLNKMGRVGSITNTMSMAAIPVGQLIFSAMFEYLPAYVPLLICAVILLGTAYYLAISSKADIDNYAIQSSLAEVEV